MKTLNPLSTVAFAMVFGGLTIAADATAATITMSPAPPNPFALSLTDIGATPSQVLSFGKFDTALGNLTGVVYRLASSIDATIDVLADGPQDSSVEFGVLVSFSVAGPGIAASFDLLPSASCTVDPDTCTSTGGDSSLFTGDDLDPNVVVAAADLAAYEGGGSVDVALSILATIVFEDCSDPLVAICSLESVFANWGGNLVIDYVYTPGGDTPVPVPASLVLFGAGLLGLGGLTALRRA